MEVEMENVSSILDSILPRIEITTEPCEDDGGGGGGDDGGGDSDNKKSVEKQKDIVRGDEQTQSENPSISEISESKIDQADIKNAVPLELLNDDIPMIDSDIVETRADVTQQKEHEYYDDPLSLYDVPASARKSYPTDTNNGTTHGEKCEAEIHNEEVDSKEDNISSELQDKTGQQHISDEKKKEANDKARGGMNDEVRSEGTFVSGQPSSRELLNIHPNINSEISPERQYDVEKNSATLHTNGKMPGNSPLPNKGEGKILPPMALDTLDRKRHESNTSQESRGNWGSRWEFLLSCVGLSVGIGNIWRFPYLAYKNGGGAFLIPYLIMLILVGKPMYFMELAFGQFASKGPLSIWKCVPISKGVGVAMVVVTFIICIYYNILMAYTIYYIASSFQAEVPWMRCDPEWADLTTCQERNPPAIGNGTNITFSADNVTLASFNVTSFSLDSNRSQTPSQQYWERYVLGITGGIDDIGTIKWDLALCLLLSWVIVVLCLLKGIKTSGKVVYFAATFPYIILIILLVAGVLQDGAADGILYFIIPKWEKLLEIQVWKAAAGQMFFSLSVSMGSLIMYSSYNPFRNNVYRDAMIVSVLDTFTSIIAGIVIFSVLGAMSKELDIPIDKIVQGGPGLAFVAYPEALSRLPVPQLWSVLFFFMLFILGLDSEFANFENIITSISDEFPILRKHKTKFCIATAIFCFFLGLPCVTYGGQYIFQLMDDYGGSTSLIFIAVAETIGIMWIYGLRRFSNDVKFMLGSTPSKYLKVTWVFFSPVLLAIIFIYTLVTHERLKYGDDYTYPEWADGLGWLLALVSMIQIPLFAIIAICKQPGPSLWAKIRQSAQSDPDWGPADPLEKEEWLKHMPSGMSPALHRSGLQSTTSINYINGSSEVFTITHRGSENPGFTP